jgi:RNA polymerase sigma-70 factor (ECF subfamily)
MPPGEETASPDWSDHLRDIAVRRDRASFETLFAYFAPRLKSYFMRVGLAADMAEDLAQETMVAVWRKADTFDPGKAAVATWIFAIARNIRIDSLRKIRDPSRLQNLFADECQQTPDEALVSSERERRVRIALTTIPAEQLRIIQLSFFEERSHSEISRQLDIPLGTVKSRVRLAMERLRTLVQELQ